MYIGLLNDSFPPTIDGVAQVVKNYATTMQKDHCQVAVVTPRYKNVTDEYAFKVIRYPSVSLTKKIEYRAGNPFDPITLARLCAQKFDIIHAHSPFSSLVLARVLNILRKVPVIFTYHTKFETDIESRFSNKHVRSGIMSFLLKNINAADEVWVVSEKGGEALANIGYRGSYRVMENGTDFARGRVSDDLVFQAKTKYGIQDEIVFLYVGRLMWYKNIRLIVDTLMKLKALGLKFRMMIVGEGLDADEIKRYVSEANLGEQATFVGPVYDRDQLRLYYCMADMMLFPSTFDTSGLVVKEAAACDCPSLLVQGSCAAEGTEHEVSAYLAQENAESCSQIIWEACTNRNAIAVVGQNAGKTLYLSCCDAVDRAYQRYGDVLCSWNQHECERTNMKVLSGSVKKRKRFQNN